MHVWSNGTSGLASSRIAALDGPHAEATLPMSVPATQLGAVRIARRVLRTVIEQAALRVRGVARMAPMRVGWHQMVDRSLPQHGIGLVVHDDVVGIELYLIIEPDTSMVEIGTQVQEAVGAAVEHILGMKVSQINVYIQDVA